MGLHGVGACGPRDACGLGCMWGRAGLRGGAYGWGCGVVHGLVAECGDVW